MTPEQLQQQAEIQAGQLQAGAQQQQRESFVGDAFDAAGSAVGSAVGSAADAAGSAVSSVVGGAADAAGAVVGGAVEVVVEVVAAVLN